MTQTFFSDDAVEIVRNRAYGYKRDNDGRYLNDMTNLFWVGDGGLHTNLQDLLIWDQSFYVPSLGEDPVAFLRLINQPNSDFDAQGTRYANGQFVGEQMGIEGFWHSGGWLGTSTYYGRFPSMETSVAMMCNDASLGTEALIQQLLKKVLVSKRAQIEWHDQPLINLDLWLFPLLRIQQAIAPLFKHLRSICLARGLSTPLTQ